MKIRVILRSAEYETFARLCLTVIFSVTLGYLIFWGTKTAWALLFSVLALLAYFIVTAKTNLETANTFLMYLAVFSIPAPFLLKFAGKDAFTLTTAMIYIVFLLLLITNLRDGRKIIEGPVILYAIPALIFLNMSLSFALNPNPIESSIRYYVANVSGLALYFVVLSVVKKEGQVNIIVKIILASLILQAGVAFLQLRAPELAKRLMMPFGIRIAKGYAPLAERVVRANGIVGDYELLAEMFFIGAILSLGLIYQTKKYSYAFPLFCCMGGIVFTKTRSSFILLVLAFAFIYLVLLLAKKDTEKTALKTVLLILGGGVLISILFSQHFGFFLQRLQAYFQSSRLISPEAFNRREVWQQALNVFLKKPSLFGMGMYDIGSLYVWVQPFHSLYMTLLYKMGFAGLLLHGVFWVALFRSSYLALRKQSFLKYWHIFFFLATAVLFMLIDNIKIEYLRYGHTIQFAWLLYGLLGALIVQAGKENENSLVS
jgi:hypothetical protein